MRGHGASDRVDSSSQPDEPTDRPQRPKELPEAQSASIHQEEKIQELRGRRDELFQHIQHQFTFIYRAEEPAIYDQYEEAKRAVHRKIKARERELIKQIQKIAAPSLRCNTFERSSREMWSRSVLFSKPQSLFDTRLWNDYVSRMPSSTHRRLVVLTAMWIGESPLSMI